MNTLPPPTALDEIKQRHLDEEKAKSHREEGFGFTQSHRDRATLLKLLEEVTAEREHLRKNVYVPGMMQCAKCKFVLVRANLHAHTGAVSQSDDNSTEPCPNGCGPLWRRTEREAGNELAERCEEYLKRAQAAEAALAEEEKAHEQTVTERDEAEEALSQAYYLIVGRSPEWSNLFGHEQALEDINDAQYALRQAIKPQATPTREEIVAAIMSHVRPDRVKVELRPTIDELERALNSEEGSQYRTEADGSFTVPGKPLTAGALADAILALWKKEG